MNKKLKFRAWNDTKKEWYKPTHEAYKGKLFELLISFGGDLICHKIDGTYHESTFEDKFIVNQFLSIWDKNGKEVYEFDIVKKTFGVGYETKHYPVLGTNSEKVSIITATWENTSTQHPDPNFLTELEVIGNIYEHPHLLK